MAGKKPNCLRPCLVLTCGDVATKKKVEKLFKSLTWLQELLRAKGVMFVALVAKTRLSAEPAEIHPGELKTITRCSIEVLYQASTFCGRSVRVSFPLEAEEKYCTLGGLIMVDNVIYGLTAGHPFKAQMEPANTDEESHASHERVQSFSESESSEASEEPSSSTTTMTTHLEVCPTYRQCQFTAFRMFQSLAITAFTNSLMQQRPSSRLFGTITSRLLYHCLPRIVFHLL